MPCVNGQPQHANFRHTIWFSRVLFNCKLRNREGPERSRGFCRCCNVRADCLIRESLDRKPERLCFCKSCGCYSLFVRAKAPVLNTEMVDSAQAAARDKDGVKSQTDQKDSVIKMAEREGAEKRL